MDLRVYAKGASFQDGVYDLRHLEALITGNRKILDKLTFIALGASGTNKRLKESLEYNARIREGSIELLIDYALSHKELFSVVAADGGQSLTKIIVVLLRDAIALREQAAKLLENGLKVNITINTNIGSGVQINASPNVIANGKTGEINIASPKIYMAALATRPAVNQIVQMIDGESVEYLSLSSANAEFKLTPHHRAILSKFREELTASIEVVGRLDMVSFSSRKGVIISSGQRYQLFWDESQRSKMQQYADIDGVVFKVRPIIDHARLTADAIAFRLVDCFELQKKLA
jgi:hypothetical protein